MVALAIIMLLGKRSHGNSRFKELNMDLKR